MKSGRTTFVGTVLTTTIFACNLPAKSAPSVPSLETNASPLALLQGAYNQIRERHYEAATKMLCSSIRLEDSVAARRYLCYSLLQRGYPQEALDQMRVVSEPTGFDLYMQGVASEMLGEPSQAAEYYQAAVRKDPANDFFRSKAIKALIVISKYQEASSLCSEGLTTTDAKSKKYYEEEMKRADLMERTIAQGKTCVLQRN